MSDNVSVKDGADAAKTFRTTDNAGVHTPHQIVDTITAGASADIGNASSTAAVITDTTGSVIGFLRGLVKWAYERMPASLGQKTKANSLSFTRASDDDPIQLTAGSSLIGGVQLGDSFYSQTITPTSSADMTSIADLTPAPNSGEHTVVESVTISVATAMIVTIKEETTLTVLKVFNLTAGNLHAEWNPARGLKLPNVNKKLRAISNTAGQIDVTVISHSAA